MNATTLTFTVVGIAQPKGSTRVVPIARVVRSLRDVRITSDNPQVKQWQGAIAKAAWCAKQELPAAERALLAGPLALTVVFYLPRPQSLAKGYVGPHLKKPDLDKLLRALKDALTTVVWNDDSQVTDVVARKAYTSVSEPPRAVVTVAVIEPALFQLEERTSA